MSTRSNIYIKLQPESKGSTVKFNVNFLDGDTLDNTPRNSIPDLEIPEDTNYLGIYCHWDGYLSGVGKALLEHYNTYDKVLNLLSMGALSSIQDDGTVTSYCGHRGESREIGFFAKKIFPVKEALQEEYAYLFKNGKWYYTRWIYVEHELYEESKRIPWKELTLKKIKEIEKQNN